MRLSSRFGLLAGGVLLLALPAVGMSQDLKKNYEENAAVRDQLYKGEVKANPKSDVHKKIAQASAEYFLLRVQEKVDSPEKLQKEFASHITKIADKKLEKANWDFRNLYGPKLVETIQSILVPQNMKQDPSMVMHAAQMLPIMGKLRQDNVSKYLVSLIEDPNSHDAIRLHALKALALPIDPQPEYDPAKFIILDFKNDKWQMDRRSQDIRNVNALSKYIERPVLKAMTADEIAVWRFLRREAIVSLASTGTPAVYAFKNPPAKGVNTHDGFIAPTLMKVLIPGAVQPESSMNEKIEAALGLCAMDYQKMPEYIADPAVYLVGLTVAEFAKEYNADLSNFTGKSKLPPRVAWRHDGRRLKEGLKQLADNANKGDAGKAAKTAEDLYKMTEKNLITQRIDQYLDVPLGRIQDVLNLMARTKPTDGKVFRTHTTPPLALP